MSALRMVFVSLAVAVPGTAIAASPFDGTWKQDAATAKLSGKPDVIALRNGHFACSSCTPPISIAADGKDHAVPGAAGYDTIAVAVKDARTTTEIRKKAGRVLVSNTIVASPDGKSATVHWVDTSSPQAGAAPVTGSTNLVRVADGAPGSHALAGSWKATGLADVSDNGMVMTFKVAGGKLSFSSPAGYSYLAPLDGSEAPMKGLPQVSTVSVRMPDARTITEVDKLDGKPVDTIDISLAGDGSTMTIVYHHVRSGRSTTFTARRV